MTDPRQWMPRGSSLERVELLRGTALHSTREHESSWADWMVARLLDGATSKDVLREMERAA